MRIAPNNFLKSLLLSGLLCPLISFGQDSLNIRSEGVFWNLWDDDFQLEYGSDVEIDGNLAFVCTERSGLRILDVSNSDAPVEVGYYIVPGRPQPRVYEVEVYGDMAYIATSKGIRALDVSNPAQPVETDAVFTNISLFYLTRHESTLYAMMGSGLRKIDLSDPATLDNYDLFTISGGCVAMDADDNYLYLLQQTGFRVYDVSDSENAVLVGQSAAVGELPTLAVHEQRAYISSNGNLRTINLDDPTHPILSPNFLDIDYLRRIVVRGNILAGVNAYSSRLRFVDISNPDSLYELSNWYFDGYYQWPLRVALSDTCAYVKTWEGGLHVVNYSEIAAPQEVGSFDGVGPCSGIATFGTQLLAANGRRGLQVADISNALNPSEIGTLAFGDGCNAVTIRDNTAYAFCEGFGLAVLSLSAGSMPTVIGQLPSSFQFDKIYSGDGFVYLHRHNFIVAVDVTDPESPALLDTVFALGDLDFSDAEIVGTTFYGTSWRGLEIYDVSSPAWPELLAVLPINNATSLAVNGTFAYVTRGYYSETDSTLAVLDVSDPRAPEIVSFTNVRDTLNYPHCYEMEYRGGMLICRESRGLRVIEVTDPMAPFTRGYYQDIYYSTESLALSGSTAYLGRDREMLVLDLSNAITDAQMSTPTQVTVAVLNGALLLRWLPVTHDAFGVPVTPLYRIWGSPDPLRAPQDYSILGETTTTLFQLGMNGDSPPMMTFFVTAE